ncbi:MAG TPA: hypothetical protein G4O04_04810 [Anaerolineae bacterium]|nr:hypothetical protein [Anaerolineae bacterium]HID83873.1 hypothetical protein [Anaerolineales bacterium]HIQ08926.1 hypothetical protein [Anaerolineaceae bacterium]
MSEENWQRALERATAYRAAGELWRAREVLQGAVAFAYHPDLYRAYGEVLFHLGDRYAAGLYLFLAGVTPQEGPYGAAVRLFEKRHHRTAAAVLAGLLPRAFRRTAPSEWPVSTREALLARCCEAPGTSCPDPEAALRRAGLWSPPHPRNEPAAHSKRRLFEWGCVALLVYLFLAALLGTGVLCYGVWHWVR